MQTEFQATFPDHEKMVPETWDFVFRDDEIFIRASHRTFSLGVQGGELIHDAYFDEKFFQFLPGEFYAYMYEIWGKWREGVASSEDISEALTDVGAWCLASANAIPSSRLFSSYNGRYESSSP